MENSEVIEVDSDTETICCDGGQDSLGHPAVYFTFNQNYFVQGIKVSNWLFV